MVIPLSIVSLKSNAKSLWSGVASVLFAARDLSAVRIHSHPCELAPSGLIDQVSVTSIDRNAR